MRGREFLMKDSYSFDIDYEKFIQWSQTNLLLPLIKLDEEEKNIPALWHPHAGASIAQNQWKIKDKDTLEAIRCHTLGSPEMSALAQIVFVADFIEPGRTFPGVEKVRLIARKNIQEAVLLKCSMTIDYLLSRQMKIHSRLLRTWNSFLSYKASN